MNIMIEAKQDFETYASEVNEQRAIPSIEDGLKPVARRILWTMYENKMFSNKPTQKSAIPVADTMGRYHPHGRIK